MKTLVVSGARSGVGKTTLARELSGLLAGSVRVKIGHCERKEKKDDGFYYRRGITFREVARRHAGASFLIIESNGILDEITPDLAVYLGGDRPKPSAALAERKADVVRGSSVGPSEVARLACRLSVDDVTMRKVVWLAGARPRPASAVVLAGGASSRMGADKSQLVVEGAPLVERIRDALSPCFDEMLLSVSEPPAHGPPAGMRVVVDRTPGLGPLEGMASSLAAAEGEVCFVTACDVPDVSLPLVFRLLAYSEEYDAVLPSFRPGTVEPLFGVYARGAAEAAGRALRMGRRKASSVAELCRTKILRETEPQWYANLNTPDDYAEYLGRGTGGKEP